MEHEQERTGDEMVVCFAVVIGRGVIMEEKDQSHRLKMGRAKRKRPGLSVLFFLRKIGCGVLVR